jgi:hypothetical protein
VIDTKSLSFREWWDTCDDAYEMICELLRSRGLRDKSKLLMGGAFYGPIDSIAVHDLTIPLYRYYLASCRRIWKLLPHEESQRGIEVAEQYLDGKMSADDCSSLGGKSEGAAYEIDYFCSPEKIAKWYRDIESLSWEEMNLLIPYTRRRAHTYVVLKDAAYFAYYAMAYPSFHSNGPPPKSYAVFLNADLLRQSVSID